MILFVVRGWRANGSIELMPIALCYREFVRPIECCVAAGSNVGGRFGDGNVWDQTGVGLRRRWERADQRKVGFEP
jgi:hypothetical protein